MKVLYFLFIRGPNRPCA